MLRLKQMQRGRFSGKLSASGVTPRLYNPQIYFPGDTLPAFACCAFAVAQAVF
jgi:hypothetical protein